MAIDHYGQEVMPSNDPFNDSAPSNNSPTQETPATSSNVENSDAPTFTDDDIPF